MLYYSGLKFFFLELTPPVGQVASNCYLPLAVLILSLIFGTKKKPVHKVMEFSSRIEAGFTVVVLLRNSKL